MTINVKDPTHITWRGMHERCKNSRHKDYKYYGGKGIKVCERWKLFDNFVTDMGRRPEGYTLDRLNTQEDYAPWNCRWVLKAVQNKENHSGVKLSRSQILEIRDLRGKMSQTKIAIKFNITQSHVSKIQLRQLWGDLD